MPQRAKGLLLACVAISMARATDSAAQSALGGSREQITVRSYNGRIWTPLSDPCSPRGGVAVWVSGDALFMTGGKYSTVRNGETVFEYHSDVWRMRAAR